MADPCLKAKFLGKTWVKPSFSQLDQNKTQCPEFLFLFEVSFFQTWRQLLKVAKLVPGCCLASGSLRFPCIGQALPLAVRLLGLQGLTNTLASAFTRWAREHFFILLGVYKIRRGMDWCFLMLRVGPPLVSPG